MRLYAFRGTRYSTIAGDTHQLAAPPFDQIDGQRQRQLHARHDCHFARLTRPDSPEESSRLLADWAGRGLIRSEDAPCLYAYEIILADGARRRLGLCGLIGIEPPGSDVVRPHESTVGKTIDERLGLLEATRTDLEPILVLCERSDELEALLTYATTESAPLCAYTDELRNEHRLFQIDDDTIVERFRRILAPSPAWIADGHHRYRVASEFVHRHAPVAGTAGAMKLAVITSLGSSGLHIDPIHRALLQPVALEAAGDAVLERTAWSGESGSELAAAVAAAPQPAIGVRAHGCEPEIWRLDPASAPDEIPASAAPLAAALVHGTLFDRFGLPPGASHDGSVAYQADADQLFEQVRDGGAAVGIWLPPTSPELFSGAVAAGELLPPKWTRFVPKLASGLVWCPHDAEVA